MINSNQQLELSKFRLLDYEIQKEKVLTMLEKTQHIHAFFDVLYATLKIIEKPSVDVLGTIYDALFSLASYIDDIKMEGINVTVDKLKIKLKKIQDAERLDRKKEGTTGDSLLIF